MSIGPAKSLLVLVLGTFLLAPQVNADNRVLDLAIGDPERRDRQVDVVLDAITDTRTGESLTPAELPARLAQVRLLFVGEEHISMEFHQVQLRVIQGLVDAGREVLIGLEMFPYTAQEPLDQWSEGLLTPQGFLELAEWYDNWGYPWDYYSAIFETARDHGLEIYAVNTPRDVVRTVRRDGFEGLSEEQKQHVPEQIDTDDDDHLLLFRTIFEAQAEEEEDFHASLDDEQLRAMFDAQCTWDATMAFNAVRALEQHDNPEAIMVVLVGGGHLSYGLGLQRQARQWYEGPMATILPVSVGDICDPVEQVRASYADFIWGLPHEENPLHPHLGMSTMKDPASGLRRVIYVSTDSPAERAGLAMGDLLLSMDGVKIEKGSVVKRLVAKKRWGDSSTITVRRDEDEIVTLPVFFRREPAEPCEDDEDETDEEGDDG